METAYLIKKILISLPLSADEFKLKFDHVDEEVTMIQTEATDQTTLYINISDIPIIIKDNTLSCNAVINNHTIDFCMLLDSDMGYHHVSDIFESHLPLDNLSTLSIIRAQHSLLMEFIEKTGCAPTRQLYESCIEIHLINNIGDV